MYRIHVTLVVGDELKHYTYKAAGWNYEIMPGFVALLNGKSNADIVGWLNLSTLVSVIISEDFED